jgi:hypothetical protein
VKVNIRPGSHETIGLSEFDAKRRELLIALSVGMTSPLFGCGGGGSPSNSAPHPPPTPTPIDIIPAVSFDGTAISAGTINDAYLGTSSALNPVFAYHGVNSADVTQLGPTYPRGSMVSADNSVSDTLSPGTIYASFYHNGKTLDIIEYGYSDGVTLYINDVFFARYGGAFASKTAQGGSATDMTLASGSSTVSGFYNEYFLRIAGGTGVLNETRQIVSYDGTTLIASVASAWTTTPDSTTHYVIQDGPQPFVLDASTGSVKYIHLKWNDIGQRKITVEQSVFAGVISDGTISSSPSWSSTPLLVVGDSFWEGEAAPINIPRLIDTFALSMGWLPTNLGEGGTGFINRDAGAYRLNFQDRIAPPNEAWRVARTATGGTYTISVAFGGVIDTTAAIPYNASQGSMESALNALPNILAISGHFHVARGDLATPLIIVGHGMRGAVISVDGSNLTGGAITVLGAYVGDVAPNVPKDSSGTALPFYLLVPGSGNDTSYSDAELQAAATYVAQQIVQRFPTASAVFTGVFGDCNAGTSTSGTTDIARNAAIAAGAAHLTSINGKVPFIDTYANGPGGLKIINGLGTVAAPQAGTNSNLKSVTAVGHPTGPGSQFLSDWLTARIKSLIT